MSDLYIVLLYLIFLGASLGLRRLFVAVKVSLLYLLVPLYFALTFLYFIFAAQLAIYITDNTPVQLYFGYSSIELVVLLILCFVTGMFITANAIIMRNRLNGLS